MLSLVIPPPPALRHVLRYILVKEMDGGCASVPVIFNPMFCLTVRGQASFVAADGQTVTVPRYILQGPSSQPRRVFYQAKTLLISVCFCTGMLQHSANLAISEILNHYPEIDQVFDAKLSLEFIHNLDQLLAQHLALHGAAAANTEAFALALVHQFQLYLQKILRPAHTLSFARGLVGARDKLFIPLAELASKFGIGERQLERRLLKVFGFTLREIRRIVRFGHCMPLLLQRGQAWGDLSQIALEAGYFDQAHMHRDFLELAGVTPAQLLQQVISKNPEFWLYQMNLHDFQNLFLLD